MYFYVYIYIYCKARAAGTTILIKQNKFIAGQIKFYSRTSYFIAGQIKLEAFRTRPKCYERVEKSIREIVILWSFMF